MAPENHCSVLIIWVSQHFMKLNREAVKMPDVQRAKVCMECVVEEAAVDGEIEWGCSRNRRIRMGALRTGAGLRARRVLSWRPGLLGRVGEWSAFVGSVRVRCKIQAV